MTPPAPEDPLSFHLSLFGPMQVLIGGQPMPPLRSRKSLWLLALLTLRRGRPVERAWLADALWPDAYPERAAANLNPVLSDLRRALGAQAVRLHAPSRHTLRLDLAGADVDVEEFDAAIVSQKREALERAAALYRGPLLEDCAEEWAPQERDMREQDCLRTLGTLAEMALKAGEHSKAAHYSHQAIRIAPLWEPAHRGLMEALTLGGNANGAMQVYREFVALLRDDPAAAPDQKMTSLYGRLRAEARRRGAAPTGISAEEAPVPVVTGYLPHPLTDLIGREDEREDVATLLRRSRLVTLAGPGGIGKTRLAVAVAGEAVSEFPDGAWLVALEALSSGEQIVTQIAGVLGLREEAGRALLTGLTEHLRPKRLLLVLDNCEHLREASAQVAEHLLRECAGLRLLTTSREVLGMTGETVWPVPALAVPDAAHLPAGRAKRARVLSGYEGVQLFVERAQAVQKTFVLSGDNALAVAQICACLGGLPLAIELAAVRVKVMTVEQIASRLDDHLALLTSGSRGAPGRHQTLRATLDWSYSLLSDPERSLLACLSVFAGGWTLDAAEAVCTGPGWGGGEEREAGQVVDLLMSLADKSLVVFEGREGVGRFRFLETIRQYAAEKLQTSGHVGDVRVRHRDAFLALAEEAKPHLRGSDQRTRLRRLEADYDNLRAALHWCEGDAQSAQEGLRLAAAMSRFWDVGGYYGEGWHYLERALGRVDAQEATLVRASALAAAGVLAEHLDSVAAQALLEESLSIQRQLGDKRGAARSLNDLGYLVGKRGDRVLERAHLEEALGLFRELNDSQGIALVIGNLAGVIRREGDYALARALQEESLQIRRDLNDQEGIALALSNLGNLARLQGDFGAAQAWLDEALSHYRELGLRPGIAWSLACLGSLASDQGDYASARVFHEESLSVRREIGDQERVAWSLGHLGAAVSKLDENEKAQELYSESLSLFRKADSKSGIAWALHYLGDLTRPQGKYEQGKYDAARPLLEESLRLFRELGEKEGVLAGLWSQAAMAQAAPWKAARLLGAAEALRVSIGGRPPVDELAKHDHWTAQARAALGEAAFDAAWEEGRALTWEQATSYALEDHVKEDQAQATLGAVQAS